MILNQASLQSTFIGFNTLFQAAMASSQPVAEARLATRIPSSGEANVYAHMAKLLRMRKWLGDREVQNVSSKSYQLSNVPFELTVAVPRRKIVDDQLGIYRPIISEMGRQTSLWLDDLVIEALQNGHDSVLGLTFDGVPFFSDSHPIDPEGEYSTDTQTNNLTAADLDETTLNAALVKMATFVGSDGRPLGCRGNLLVVPPQFELKAKKLLVATQLASGASNVLAGMCEILVLPQLAGAATTWYLMDTTRVIKPLISQEREAPDFVSMTDPSAEGVFNRDEYKFGSKARGAAGYGLWFLAIRNTPSP